MGWKITDMPRMDGRIALVTGGASGIGFQVARELGARGAQVVILGRDEAKGEQAVAELRATGGDFRFEQVDLASLDSISAFAARWNERPIHLLINVAGVMALPEFARTVDGFEMHMGTNFLGHFALTGRLLSALRAGQARVVTVSALVGRWKMARLDPDDLQGENQAYSPMGAYARSKLADIMFAVELQRRFAEFGITSVAVDPGTAATNLQRHARGATRSVGIWLSNTIGYPLDRVAENVLFAAIMPEVASTTLIGPSFFVQRCASPKDVGLPPLAKDSSVRDALWAQAAALTGVRFGSGDATRRA
ncbi:SDR family NAD(P)-dependent oxidoreductase [Hyalangium versicolor]|uniref:SDR family NAD(P)-dependent oxidoreductase n=1 Tax=Hyalangium versicolor TaxID=2861190 RepID=UPI001CC9C64E|nr:SDR family NAD(P)-dependent oxidoreductase [Hyalangium versicolor]